MENKSFAWIIYLGPLRKKSCQLPGNSHDVQETLPSNLNSPRNFSRIRTRGPILLLCPCLRRQSKRGKYPYSPRGHAMKSCNTFDVFAFLDNIIFSLNCVHIVYIQCFYVLINFSISVLYHGHQLSIYCILLYFHLLRPYCWLTIAGQKKNFTLFYIYYWSKKKAGCIMLQHLRSSRFQVAITRVEMGSGIPKKKSCRVIVMLKCWIPGGKPWQKQVNVWPVGDAGSYPT